MVIVDQQQLRNNFDFESGALCLDFSNTSNWHASPHPQEGLRTYLDLLGWAQAAGLLIPAQTSALLELANQNPEAAQASLDQAIDLREVIYHLFSAYAAGRPLAQTDLDVLNRSLRQALAHLQLRQTKAGLALDWEDSPGALERIVWPVARSAAELLSSDLVNRVGECQDDRGCGYLFLDTSRNRSRRWCSMESCGNRAKAQRHYHRAR